MGEPLRVLLVEDSPDDSLMLLRELRQGGYDPAVERVETADTFKSALEKQVWDVVIADYSLPKFSAPAALAIFKESGLDLPFLIVSGVVGEADAVAAMKAGAHDYIRKNNPARLIPAIERELREADLRRRNRRLEEALEQSQRMEMIGRFARHIAGEFNDALVSIAGGAASLLSRLPPDSSLREEAQAVQAAAERAGMLTQQLLAFSQSRTLQPRLLDLNAVIADVQELLRHLVGKHIRLTTALDPAIGKVSADQSQIEQLILNLVVNARDATPAGGKISIETAGIELDESYVPQYMSVKPGRYVVLAVADTGSGISPEARPRLFEPFFDAKAKGKPAGLELAFVYNIVKQNGGEIRVEGAPGRGATFRIYLPQAEAASQPAPRPEPAAAASAGQTILLVDDDERVRRSAREALAAAGYAVLEASDGRTGRLIAKSFRGPIQLLMTELMLPDMSGYDLVNEVAQLRPGIRALYQCACDAPADALIDGGHSVVDKHASGEALLEKVREALAAAPPVPAGCR